MTTLASAGGPSKRHRRGISKRSGRRGACIGVCRRGGRGRTAVSVGESVTVRTGMRGALGMGARLRHDPVLYHEVLEFLRVRPGGVYVDCTTGLGGHSEGILKGLQGSGRLVALDRDSGSIERARTRLGEQFENFSVHHENFKNLSSVLAALEIRSIDGCLLDLGMSSFQLDSGERGFSFQLEGPLDMRMDRDQELTASQLVNELSERAPGGDSMELWRRKVGAQACRSHRCISATGEAAYHDGAGGFGGAGQGSAPGIPSPPRHPGISSTPNCSQSGAHRSGADPDRGCPVSEAGRVSGGHRFSQPRGQNRKADVPARGREVYLSPPPGSLRLSSIRAGLDSDEEARDSIVTGRAAQPSSPKCEAEGSSETDRVGVSVAKGGPITW